MTWARFDDVYDDARKVKRAWRREPAAVGLHAMAVTYCSRHETDGLVDVDWIEEKLPDEALREGVLRTLVDGGLFEVLEAGTTRELPVPDRTKAGAHTVTLGPVDEQAWIVHDYLDYNPSTFELAHKRGAEADRKRQARESAAARSAMGGGVRAASARTPRGRRADTSAAAAPDETCPAGEVDPRAVEAWASAAPGLKARVGDGTWDIWLAPVHPHRIEAGRLVLAAPTALTGQLRERFAGLITEAVGQPVHVVSCATTKEMP